MKRMMILLLLFAAGTVLPADFLEIPTERKIGHPDLTFAVTFDNYATRAELAKGSGESLTQFLYDGFDFHNLSHNQGVAANACPARETLQIWDGLYSMFSILI